MPRVNIYIRNEDQAKWQAIADKPEWLHVALNTSVVEMAINRTDKPLLKPYKFTDQEHREVKPGSWKDDQMAAQKAKEREELAALETKGKEQAKKDFKVTGIWPKNGYCEHFQPKGQCMVKGCKYGKGK